MLYTNKIIKSDYISSFWIEYYQESSKQTRSYQQVESSFSPTTNWEKVFGVGDMINRKLNLTEKDITDDISDYRRSKKKSRR